jgi:hypothetical protein
MESRSFLAGLERHKSSDRPQKKHLDRGWKLPS